MAKKEPQITVTTTFDGVLQAKDIIADLIIEKFYRIDLKNPSQKGKNLV